jgi:hypothetical protein
MKIRLVALLGLAISFAVPAFAQQTKKPNPQVRQRLVARTKAHTGAIGKHGVTAMDVHPIVVVGIPANSVALKHPTPTYPRVASSLHISGDVVISVQIENGNIVRTTVDSGSSVLAEASRYWILDQWKFKPSVNGIFTIPISYKESA